MATIPVHLRKIDWAGLSTFKTSRDYTYSYKYLKSTASSSRPVLLFLHGYPNEPEIWDTVASALHADGWSCLIPALLGYERTSKPADAEAYNSEDMVKDLDEILIHEDIQSVIAVGHDWGSYLASRMALWLPEKTKGLVLMCVQYLTPSGKSVDEFIAQCREDYEVDYDNYTYMRFLSSDEAQELMPNNLEMLSSISMNPAKVPELYMAKDKLRDFYRAGKPLPIPDTPQAKAMQQAIMAKWSKEGMATPLNWYRALGQGIHWKHEKNLPESAYTIRIPTLYIGAFKDKFCPWTGAEKQKKWIPDLTIRNVDANHFLQVEKPAEVAELLKEFVGGEKF